MQLFKVKSIVLVVFFLSFSQAYALYSPIEDQGQFFSPSTIQKVDRILAKLEQKTHPPKTIIIKTRGEIPKGVGLQEYFKAQYPAPPFDGVFIFLTQNPKKVLVVSSKGAGRKLGKEHLDKARGLIIEQFKAKNYDQGLISGSKYLYQQLVGLYALKTQMPPTKSTQPPLSYRSVQKPSFPWSRIFWFLAFLAIVLWIVSIFQKRRRRPVSSYPGAYNSSGLGNDSYNDRYGQGGGMLKSVLGGVAGAMAGSWLYDKFFNNSSSSSTPTPDANNAYAAPPQQEQNDFDSYRQGDSDFGEMAGGFDTSDDWGGFDDGGGFDGGDDW